MFFIIYTSICFSSSTTLEVSMMVLRGRPRAFNSIPEAISSAFFLSRYAF